MATTTENIILNIEIEGGSLIAKIAALRKETDALKESNKQLAKEAKAALESGATDVYDAKTKAIVQNEAAIKALSATSRNYQNVLDLQTKANVASTDSYEAVLRRQQLAQITLKNLEGTLKKNADGTYELTDAYKAASKEVLQAKEAVLKFDAGIKDGRTNVGNYTASFVEAINQTGLFGSKLALAKEAFAGVKTGLSLVKDGTDLVKDGFKEVGGLVLRAKDSLVNFKTNLSLEKENKSLKETEGGFTILGSIINKAATSGARAMNVLKSAIASTGIGLLLIAVGSLVAYFNSTDEGANKLKVAFAAVGQIVDGLISVFAKFGEVMVNAFTNPLDAIEKLTQAILHPIDSFNKAKAATASFIEEQKKLAKIAAENEQAQINYNKSLRASNEEQAKNNLLIGDLKTLSEDKTKTDKERIAAMQEAGKLEKANIEIDVANAEKRKQLAENELQLAKANGKGKEDALNKLSAATIEYNKLVDDAGDKEKETASETSKLRLSLMKETASSQIAILDNDLKAKQLAGQQDIALQKEIEKKKLDVALQDTSLSNAQREKLRSDYHLAIATIDKAAADEALTVQKNIEDLSIASIEDKVTREIAVEALAAQRKIELLKGTAEEIQQQKELILIDSQNKINAIVAENDAKDVEQAQKTADEKKAISDQQVKDTAENAAKIQALEQARLDVATSVVQGLKALLGEDEKARKKYGDALKALSIAEIGINLAKQLSGIAAANAKFGIFGTPIAAAQSIQAIIQAGVNTALVARQKFAKGGIFGGNSHANGGTVGHFSDGTSVEVEKDEAFFVINKRSTAMINNLSKINQAGGGVKFADGGTTSTFVSNGAFSNGDLQSFLADLLISLPQPVIAVQDINEVQGRTARVVDRSIL